MSKAAVTWGGLAALVGVAASFASAWAGVGAAMDARLGHERELARAVYASREQVEQVREQLPMLNTSLRSLTVEIERLRDELRQLRAERRR